MDDAKSPKRNILPAVGTEQCFTSYANYGNIISTPFDVQIVFSELIEQKGDLVPHARARIIMSPEHAALLVRVLADRLTLFVEMNGPLRKIANVESSPPADKVPETTDQEPNQP